MVVRPAVAGELVVGLDDVGAGDVERVGGKNASLGEMRRALSGEGVRVPGGFAVTAEAYRFFLREAGLENALKRALEGLDARDTAELAGRGRLARELLLGAPLPQALRGALEAAYSELGEDADVAVRSSATAEDLPEASFAGQQESYLHIRGREALCDAVRRCFASLFTDRAISYRQGLGFPHERVALSVGVQRMVRSDLAGAGVAFTLDTESGFKDVVLLSAAYGLGESVVQGTVDADEYRVFKPALKAGFKPILGRKLGEKATKRVYAGEGGGVRSVPVDAAARARFVLDEEEILRLARWACLIEEHYAARAGRLSPMDIEWAKDGPSGELFIVQARPETAASRRSAEVLESFRLKARGAVLAVGRSVGMRIGQGRARRVSDPGRAGDFKRGEVLVAEKTDPDWEPIMRKAAAVVTDRGGRTCHAAIVSRELGLPAVVGTGDATRVIEEGRPVTVSCAEGETGRVYDGLLPFEVRRVDLRGLERPRTAVMMNVADPEEAFELSLLPNDGVGLARMEFIVSHFVKIHPMALVRFDEVLDEAARHEIERLCAGYADKRDYFVDKLAEGVATIAAAFYPKDVILRMSDFKTGEYAALLGGKAFEPREENPMLGFRGAFRYVHERYREGFALECRAALKVRARMGLRNLKLMIPFCRTLEEARRVLEELKRHGLKRGEDGLEVYMMCEIPSNAVLAERFAELFDGFSIGSNDLTQLVLGVDRDSEVVAPVFSERDEAVLRLIAQAIAAAKAKGRKIGICGQGPSDDLEFARFLVERGIDSLSLNPDAVLRTTLAVLELEGRLCRWPQDGRKESKEGVSYGR